MLKTSKTLKLLKKFSKLTDEQYKSILSDPAKIKELDQSNLLDSFYKSRPDKTEKDLIEQLNFQRSIKNEAPKFTINNPKVLNFLLVYGKLTLPRDILFRIAKHIIPANEVLYSESIEKNQFVEFMDNLSEFTIENIIKMYYKVVKYSDKNVLEFIDAFEELEDLEYKKEITERGMGLFSDVDQKSIDQLKKKVSNILYVILDQINEISAMKSNIPLEGIAYKQTEESLKLKQSDMFDFVFENKPDKVA